MTTFATCSVQESERNAAKEVEIYQSKKELAKRSDRCVKYFNVLGDTTRLQIIIHLLKEPNREMSVDAITQAVFLSRPAVSHHLKILKDNDVLVCRAQAQYNYYSINKDAEIWQSLCDLFSEIDDLLKKFKSIEAE